ncbi:hypothetical protein Ate02nite_61390 [Paractinoplanes tereljensis]|uniref:HTH cro/C1-type domain-containing protein n=1 Tax=Paractinoplanes tereljensis TaxID=571912 RepID=A0A919NQT4_9ACTN|nr:hypothetical protein Ate02nite_61390 [Actinoplanes tereljensis]
MTVGRARRENSRYRPQAGLLATRLRTVRIAQGLTQGEVARRAGIGIATLRKIESGNVVEPGYFTVLAIAAALSAEPALLSAAVSTERLLPPEQNAGLSVQIRPGVTARDSGQNSDRADRWTYS